MFQGTNGPGNECSRERIVLRMNIPDTVCNRWVGGVCLWVCYHDNSKLHESILTKLGL